MKIIFKLLIINALVFIYNTVKSQAINNDTTIIYNYKEQLKVLMDAKNYENSLALNDSILNRTLHYSDIVKRQIWLDRAGIFTAQKKWEDAHEAYKYTDSITLVKTKEDSIFRFGSLYEYGISLYKNSNYLLSKEIYSKAVEIGEKLKKEKLSLLGNSYINYGYCLMKLGQCNEAIALYEKALLIREEQFGKKSVNIVQVLHNIAVCYQKLRNFEKSIELLQDGIEIRTKVEGENSVNNASLYNAIGTSYSEIGKLNLAYFYFEKAMKIIEKVNGPYSLNLIQPLTNLGSIKLINKEAALASQYFLRALELQIKLNNTQLDNRILILNNLGSANLELGNKQDALYFYLLADSLLRTSGQSMPYIEELVSQNMGALSSEIGDYQNAYSYYERTASIIKENQGERLDKVFDILRAKLSLAVKTSNIKDIMNIAVQIDSILINENMDNSKIIEYYHVLVSFYIEKYDLHNAEKYLIEAKNCLHKLLRSENVEYSKLLCSSLEQKLNLARFKINGKQEFYDQCVVFGDSSIYLIEKLTESSQRDDQFFLFNNFYDVYENYIDLLTINNLFYDTNKKDKIFVFSEKCKSLYAYKSFLLNNIRNDKDLENSLEITKEQYITLSGKVLPDSFSNSKLFFLRRILDSLEAIKIERSSKHDFINFNKPNIFKLQNELRKDQSIITYFTVKSSKNTKIVINHITKGSHDIVVENLNNVNVETLVQEFNNSINSYFVSPFKPDTLYESNIVNYCDIGFKLYSHLFNELEPFLNKNLIIIPDYTLSNLPFGALLKNKPKDITDFNSYRFLEEEFIISYLPSVNYISIAKNNNPEIKNLKYIAFAPFAYSENILIDSKVVRVKKPYSNSPLKYSLLEVQNISDQFGFDLFIGKKGTIQQFMQNFSNSSIVHLATHSFSNYSNFNNSFVAFSYDSIFGGELKQKEIYNLKSNADLIVLSSCESGIGMNLKGEGSMSLSHGFLAAGAKSVVSSLWPVNDQTTQILMTEFYTQLKVGNNKKQALRNAKLKLINGKNKSFRHPFYWSAFNLYGNIDAIKF